jgi:hypothetical protein
VPMEKKKKKKKKKKNFARNGRICICDFWDNAKFPNIPRNNTGNFCPLIGNSGAISVSG